MSEAHCEYTSFHEYIITKIFWGWEKKLCVYDVFLKLKDISKNVKSWIWDEKQTKIASFLPISKCQANADHLNVIFTSQKEVQHKFQISLVFNCKIEDSHFLPTKFCIERLKNNNNEKSLEADAKSATS